MEIPFRISTAAERLKAGRRVNRITVRDFLSLFGAERRGATKVQEIRAILDALDLQTTPDFETEWIDAPIWLKLKDGVLPVVLPSIDEAIDLAIEDLLEGESPGPEQAEAATGPEVAPESPAPPSNIEVSESILSEDPTYRIGKLPAANKTLVIVGPNDPLMKAITLMLQHDLSQLPIM